MADPEQGRHGAAGVDLVQDSESAREPRRVATLPAWRGFICLSIQVTVSGPMTRSIESLPERGRAAGMAPCLPGEAA